MNCKICNTSEKVETHHITYIPEDIVNLCSKHHFCVGMYAIYQLKYPSKQSNWEEYFTKRFKVTPDEVLEIREKYPELLQRQDKSIMKPYIPTSTYVEKPFTPTHMTELRRNSRHRYKELRRKRRYERSVRKNTENRN